MPRLDAERRARRDELARQVDEKRTQIAAGEDEAARLERLIAVREAEIAGYRANLEVFAKYRKDRQGELKRLEREAAKVSGRRSTSRPRAHPKAARAKT